MVAMLTTKQAAEQLGVAPRTVVKMIKRGDLPGSIRHPSNRIGYRIPQQSVTNYLARHTIN